MDTEQKRQLCRAAWDKVAFEVGFDDARPNGLFVVAVGISAAVVQFYNRSLIAAKMELAKFAADNGLPMPDYVQTHRRTIDGWDFITLTVDFDEVDL